MPTDENPMTKDRSRKVMNTAEKRVEKSVWMRRDMKVIAFYLIFHFFFPGTLWNFQAGFTTTLDININTELNEDVLEHFVARCKIL